MGWINLAFLCLGLGIGVSYSWLVRQAADKSRSLKIPPTSSSLDHPDTQNEKILTQLQQTRLAYQMATEMCQFKAGFLARVSHELRSPLSGMMSTHQLILSDLCDDPTEERDFVAQAQASAVKMMTLIDQILDVAKTEHGTNKLQIQPLQLAEVLQKVQNLTHLQAQNRNLRLQVVLPDSEIYVLADPRWLRQVLVSLIDTSISGMDQGSITVSTDIPANSPYAHIWIDDGRSLSDWSEPLDLLTSSPNTDPAPPQAVTSNFSHQSIDTHLSAGLTLLTSQTLLELMHGHLELLPAIPEPAQRDAPEVNPSNSITRIQCSIPLLIPEPDSTLMD